MNGLLVIGGACAVLDWIAVGAGRRRMELLTKPATMLVLLAWFTLGIPSPWPALGTWFAAGLALSLIGDIFLLYSERWFVYGLGAFLLAQAAYVVALNSEGVILSARSGVAALAIAALSFCLYAILREALSRTGNFRMMIPLGVYLAAIGLMMWSAACATLRPGWPALARGALAIGGGLFYGSDSILAWNRFVHPFQGARILTRLTYHLAQFGLAVGVSIVLSAA